MLYALLNAFATTKILCRLDYYIHRRALLVKSQRGHANPSDGDVINIVDINAPRLLLDQNEQKSIRQQ